MTRIFTDYADKNMIIEKSILIHRELTEKIIGAAMEVHSVLGTGFLEKVYENALSSEVRKRGLSAQQQHPITVFFKDEVVGQYQADIIVNDIVLVELKAVEQLVAAHAAQLRNYLKATRLQVGLLINFSGSRLEWKRIVSTK
jgi:GxxExxY protein